MAHSLAFRLEHGTAPYGRLGLAVHRWAERLWSDGVRRPVALPAGISAIGVGGATLGGSGKSPLSIALCTALARRGERWAMVGHAYRAVPGRARMVAPTDDVRVVGDEALVAAAALYPRVAVVVAPARQEAAEFAAHHASALVFDGLLQARPQPLTRSVLALDESSPWGHIGSQSD